MSTRYAYAERDRSVTNESRVQSSRGPAASSGLPAFLVRRNIVSDIVQGIIVGAVLAFITFQIVSQAYVTKINGWTTMLGCGKPGNSVLLRGACAKEFPGPINVAEEAVYWTTKEDGAGEKLSGQHSYLMHFPSGQLPPNDAFWSLTLGNTRNQFVGNPINRYSVSNRSGLVSNADGSVDIYIQHAAPKGPESNWLPAPKDQFLLWLRVYLPRATILNGKYQVPPVVETR